MPHSLAAEKRRLACGLVDTLGLSAPEWTPEDTADDVADIESALDAYAALVGQNIERDILRMFKQDISASKLAELHGFDAHAFGQAATEELERIEQRVGQEKDEEIARLKVDCSILHKSLALACNRLDAHEETSENADLHAVLKEISLG